MNIPLIILLVLGIAVSLLSQILLYRQGEKVTKTSKIIFYSLTFLGSCIVMLSLILTVPSLDKILFYIFATVSLKTIVGYRFPWEPTEGAKRKLKEHFDSYSGFMSEETRLKMLKQVERI